VLLTRRHRELPSSDAAFGDDSPERAMSLGWTSSNYSSSPLSGITEGNRFKATTTGVGRCAGEPDDGVPRAIVSHGTTFTFEPGEDAHDLLVAKHGTEVRWSRPVGYSACGRIAVLDEQVLVWRIEGGLDVLGLDRDDGRLAWSLTLNGPGDVSTVLDVKDGFAYIGGAGVLARVRTTDGAVIWATDIGGGGACDAAAADSGEVVWVQSCDGAVRRLSIRTGRRIGGVIPVGESARALVTGPEGAFVISQTDSGGRVEVASFDDDGSRRWESAVIDGRYLDHAVAEGGWLLLGAEPAYHARIWAIDRRSGDFSLDVSFEDTPDLRLRGGGGRTAVIYQSESEWGVCESGPSADGTWVYSWSGKSCIEPHSGKVDVQLDIDRGQWLVTGFVENRSGRL
jgi:hypothetical protein